MGKPYTKESVQFHREGMWGPGVPAVNVKMLHMDLGRVSLPLDQGSVDGVEVFTDKDFSHGWVEEHVNEDLMEDIWTEACRRGWELLEGEAQEIWGKATKVYSEGRSGGWAIVDGIKGFEGWDAVDLAKWRRFEDYCQQVVADLPRSMLEDIYMNLFVAQEPAIQ
jgi:hypothetical protein